MAGGLNAAVVSLRPLWSIFPRHIHYLGRSSSLFDAEWDRVRGSSCYCCRLRPIAKDALSLEKAEAHVYLIAPSPFGHYQHSAVCHAMYRSKPTDMFVLASLHCQWPIMAVSGIMLAYP